MNAGAAKDLVQRFGFDDGDPIFDWLNEAQNIFHDAYNWPWFKFFITGTLDINGNALPTTPSDQVTPNSLLITVGTEVIPLTYKSYTQYITDCGRYTDAFGVPEFWTSTPGDILYYPKSSVAYPFTYYYNGEFTPVDSDGDEFTGWPTRYHYTLVRGAAAIGLDVDNQEERAAAQMGKFTDAIDRAMMKYRSEQLGRIDRVRNVAGY